MYAGVDFIGLTDLEMNFKTWKIEGLENSSFSQ